MQSKNVIQFEIHNTHVQVVRLGKLKLADKGIANKGLVLIHQTPIKVKTQKGQNQSYTVKDIKAIFKPLGY